ncbi:hypothetical protein KUTeg_007400 [Tegillarca granosa]|uniref:Uncharacterized protein n=1 Tax=Tegillarca granosa TaxID=220873 RepID=A0ABQ9FG70_TEGGR|nr:hypothetical protein KUTeg_007400 [Tegillarca granosa]
MEGARRSFPLVLVIFGTLLQGNVGHPGHEQPYQSRREVVVDEEVNRCTALVRRTSIERQLVSYPCFRPVPGITPVVAHQSPAGLVCKGYTSVPATNYYRVKMCCPGWSHDQQGRCVIRGGRQLIVQKSILPKKSLDQLTKYPASYEDRRNKMLQLLQPFLAPLFQQQQQQSPATWDDMAASRGQWEEMARNSQSWENIMRQRMQEVVRQRAIMRQQYIRHMQEQMFRQIQMALNNRLVPFSMSAQLMTRIPNLNRQVHVLRRPQQTSRAPDNLVSPPVQRQPFHPHTQMPQIPVKPFPQIPNIEQRPGFPNHLHQMNHGHPPMMMHQGPRPQTPMMMGHHHPGQHHVPQIPALPNNLHRGFPGVQLPQIPIEMPPVSVQPGPNSPFGPPQCFDNYNTVVKKCYGESGAALPNGNNMFSEMAYELKQVCIQRNSIIDCIQQHFPRCHHPQEQMMIRGSFETTITELHGMCEMHNIDPEDKSMQIDNTNNNIEDLSQTNEGTIETRFTGDAIQDNQHETTPEPVKPEVVPIKTETKTEEKPKHNTESVKTDKDVKAKQKVKQIEEPKKEESSIEKNKLSAQRAHDIMVEELEQEVHHHYLPLLIGTAVAIGAIVILLITLVCLCCRRRMKKKIYIEKEPEKPKLLDGIYTIGVPPPIYEVNGIPPLSYEEAKGLKISGTPTSTRKNMDNEVNDQQEASSVNGAVSDI